MNCEPHMLIVLVKAIVLLPVVIRAGLVLQCAFECILISNFSNVS